MSAYEPLGPIFQWDVRNWSRALALWDRHLNAYPGGQALAIGERDGGLSLLLARRGLITLCTDLNGPSPQARELHQQAGVGHLVRYGAEDVLALSHPAASFDVVIFKSVIGALGSKEKQARAIDEMHRVLKPGGVLLFAENLAGTAPHAWLRRRYVRWAQYWRYLKWPADGDLFSAFAKVETRSTGLFAVVGRSEAQRNLLGRLDGLICPLVPRSWHYILVGACVKGTLLKSGPVLSEAPAVPG